MSSIWRHTVARSLPPRFHGERASRNNDALVRTARHCATKITDMRRGYRFLVALALEEHLERNQWIDLQRSIAVDALIARTASHDDLRETSFTQNPLT